jgi:predicted DNA-binding protein
MRPDLAEKLRIISQETGKPVEKIIEEAIELYVKLATYREQPPRAWKPCSW